ncbi:MAG: sulfatase [Isosphaeraceae bacterium]|jgi:arylsulfatase A-like enzyme|nr:MAG: sulfatase [Isosphaeraceae bacterium]
MRRPNTWLVWAWLGLGAVGLVEAAERAVRPNILWLVAEDFGPALGCYGQKGVQTPHLDRLAARGMRFTHAYTTSPVCSPSRSAFMTGMYQTSIGAHNHRSHRDDGYRLPAEVQLISVRMREAGYFTANVREFPGHFGFRGTGKTDWNFTVEGKPFDSDRWADLKAHEPFFAQVNFEETHRPFTAPRRVDPATVEIPPYEPDDPLVRADRAAYLDEAIELDRQVGLILDQLTADGLAGRTIVVFMGDNGEAHIRGKQFCYEEGLRVPLIVAWADAFEPPAGFEPGTVSDRLIEAIDLAPTFLAVAGLSKPEGMQGRVLFGPGAEPLREFAFGARDRCDETVFRIRTVRDRRYRYIRNFTPDRPFLQANTYKEKSYPAWNLLKQRAAAGMLTPEQAFLAAPTMPEEELYDLETDPHQVRNLAGSADPKHRAVRDRLREALNRWIEETGDQGAVLEPEELARSQGVTRPDTNPLAGYAPDTPTRRTPPR